MARNPLAWLAMASSAVLAGCASTGAPPVPPPQGDASYRMVEPPGARHYQLALGQVARGATLEANPAPVYPPELLPLRLPPVELQAKLVVDTAGRVGEVRIDAGSDENRQRFADAVRQAVLSWRFTPLVIDRWAADADGNSHRVDGGAQPFSYDYVFRFECRDGQAVVSSNAAATP
ncbi:hypothetical protein ASG87_17640 [Frateuria sp. Soil773]|uniref:hypothetical protein n=1 Tax=Frateuria sp. Soil773 TaxID=1736407 RepID=UPI00070221F0|nr:hypothetical protein [Frateuria sp. Soil773]KRE94427.1 hypothetical protein ASG87_17640 [Frateuria sp. Soil773]